MADIDTSGGGKKKGKKVRGKKLSTRVDFTPMVDLGFLLITFFMLTTSMNKPSTMEINMPFKDDNIPVDGQTKIKESQAMTIMLTGHDQIMYYFGFGDLIGEANVTTFGAKGIRAALMEKSREINPRLDSLKYYKREASLNRITEEAYKAHSLRLKSDKKNVFVRIMYDNKARYKNLVDILDEMTITNIGQYAIVDITPEDLQMLAKNQYIKK